MTIDQRARLVVALGVLNLCLAAVALAIGTFGLPVTTPTRPGGSDTVANVPSGGPGVSQPAPSAAVIGSPPAPTAPPNPGGSATPGGTTRTPPPGSPTPTRPPTAPPPTEPPLEPTPSVVASPTPRVIAGVSPRPILTPSPTPERTVAATKWPATPPPTEPPPPAPAAAGSQARPPCPGDVTGAPGHHKTFPPPDRPCSKGDSEARQAEHDAAKAAESSAEPAEGAILALPLLATLVASAGALAARARRRLA